MSSPLCWLTKITSLRAMGSEGINSCIIKSYHDWSRGWVSWHREWGWVLCQALCSTILEIYQVGEHGVFCPCRTRRRGMHGNYTAAHTKQQLLWRPNRWTSVDRPMDMDGVLPIIHFLSSTAWTLQSLSVFLCKLVFVSFIGRCGWRGGENLEICPRTMRHQVRRREAVGALVHFVPLCSMPNTRENGNRLVS